MRKSKKNKIRIYSKEDRHFRSKRTNAGGKSGKHPAYVVGEGKSVYASFGITHDHKKGKGHYNHPLTANPDCKDPQPSYIHKQMEIRPKKDLGTVILSFLHLSKKDEEYVDGRILKALAKDSNLIPPPDVKKLKPWKPPEQEATKREGTGGKFARKRKKK